MTKLKRIALRSDNLIQVEVPVSDAEINARKADYTLLAPNQFAKKYRSLLFHPVKLDWEGKIHQIQLNACTNPFCKWFGMPQERFELVKQALSVQVDGQS